MTDAEHDAVDVPDLSPLDAAYAAATPLDYAEVPDGKYTVRMADARLGTSRAGDPLLTYDLVVLAGPHAQRHLFKNSALTEAALPVVKGDLQTLGLTLPQLSQLPGRLHELVGLTLTVTKRTNDDHSNVYFNRRVPAPAAQSETGPADAPCPA